MNFQSLRFFNQINQRGDMIKRFPRKNAVNFRHLVFTCFTESGKVSFPFISGTPTNSLQIRLQDLQTDPNATRFLLAGHVSHRSSSRATTSLSNSVGIPAQFHPSASLSSSLSSVNVNLVSSRSFNLLLEKLPIPSLTICLKFIVLFDR